MTFVQCKASDGTGLKQNSFSNISCKGFSNGEFSFSPTNLIFCLNLLRIDFEKRKVNLSIKLLEEIEKKEALEKYGSEGSGKNLPFSSLSEDLQRKKDKK